LRPSERPTPSQDLRPVATGSSEARYRDERVAHWNHVAVWMDTHHGLSREYHRQLARIFRFLVPPGKHVLEVGSGQGDLLAALQPARGVGVDFSGEMVERAQRKYPSLEFINGDAHTLPLDGPFDFIILSDLVNELWDAQKVFQELARLCTPRTRLVLNFYNRLWEKPLAAARRLGLARPNLSQNWFTASDVGGLLALADFEVIRHREEILLPLRLPLVSMLGNRYLAKIWPLNLFDLTHFLVARPTKALQRPAPRVSVIVPARNEAGNIPAIFDRTPKLGSATELIFVEGGSHDDTYERIEREIAARPGQSCKLLKQIGKGKGDAVRLGFSKATGDLLMILDADLTVPPEDLPEFFEIAARGHGDFVQGTRLVYPMEPGAMRFFNRMGNVAFSQLFSYLLQQPIKDTLCGTKVLWRADYERIAAARHYFGDFDPFGDFDLIFGAARLNLKITEIPVRYRDRTYGETNISRWKHGWLLLRMSAVAARKLKFV